MADIRSQIGHRVRKQAALGIFGPTIAVIIHDDNMRTENTELKQMVGWDAEKNTYSSHVPLLYGEGSGPRTERAFRSQVLMRVSPTLLLTTPYLTFTLFQALRVILFGPSSLNEGSLIVTRDTYGKLWGVKTVTAGAMATAATVVRKSCSFLIST